MNDLQACRDRFARQIVKRGAARGRLIAAFSSTPREHYLGQAPWPILTTPGAPPLLSDDPRLLYQDVLVALSLERGINNGQPSLHALCIAACAPSKGESLIHVGAGTGYYTAILAALVGTGGSVLAYEIESDLAERARLNLRHIGKLRVVAGSGSDGALPPADVIYVSAGATHPVGHWLDALTVGGRLVFPLTPNQGFGGMLLVTRKSAGRYAASFIARVAFIPCIGARDDATANALAEAFATKPLAAVKCLHRATQANSTAWCAGKDWWLSGADAVSMNRL